MTKYFLNKRKHTLTENDINEFVNKSEPLSWYSLGKVINDTSSIAKIIDGTYCIEYKHLRHLLYYQYGITLRKDTSGQKIHPDSEKSFESEDAREKEYNSVPKSKDERSCIIS